MSSTSRPVAPLPLFNGHDDPATFEEFLSIFEIFFPASTTRQNDLLRSIAPPVLLQLIRAGFQTNQSYSDTVANLKIAFYHLPRGRLAAYEARESLTLSDGQPFAQFVLELPHVAREAGEDALKGRIVALTDKQLPQKVKMALGGLPKDTTTLAELVVKAQPLMDVHQSNRQAAVFALQQARAQSPHRGRHPRQERRDSRPRASDPGRAPSATRARSPSRAPRLTVVATIATSRATKPPSVVAASATKQQKALSLSVPLAMRHRQST